MVSYHLNQSSMQTLIEFLTPNRTAHVFFSAVAQFFFAPLNFWLTNQYLYTRTWYLCSSLLNVPMWTNVFVKEHVTETSSNKRLYSSYKIWDFISSVIQVKFWEYGTRYCEYYVVETHKIIWYHGSGWNFSE